MIQLEQADVPLVDVNSSKHVVHEAARRQHVSQKAESAAEWFL